MSGFWSKLRLLQSLLLTLAVILPGTPARVDQVEAYSLEVESISSTRLDEEGHALFQHLFASFESSLPDVTS